MRDLIDSWNIVATVFAVWGALGLVTALIICVVASRLKGKAQAEEDEIELLESMLRHPSGKDHPHA